MSRHPRTNDGRYQADGQEPRQAGVPPRGPRPWHLHLNLATRLWLGPEGENNPLALPLREEGLRRYRDFLRGVQRYQAHPAGRASSRATALRFGRVGVHGHGHRDGLGRGLPVLAVPSLVNRSHVLDLEPQTSLMRALAAEGFAPALLDWGSPGEGDAAEGLDALIAGPLEQAAEALVARHGAPLALLGYCMGGLLALALAVRRPELVSRLVLCATPWDFSAYPGTPLPFWPMAVPLVPVDVLQTLFALADPSLTIEKFRRFAAMDEVRAQRFVLVEDWVNDGVPLSRAVAQETFGGWFGANLTMQGRWQIGGTIIDPAQVKVPTLVVVPQADRIVPAASAQALAQAIPGAEVMTPPLGHVGMMVSRRAPALVHRPVAAWLRQAGTGSPTN